MADQTQDRKDPKPRAFRWMHRGVLHIDMPDGTVKVVHPGTIVRKAEHLAALGGARIEEFIRDKIAEVVTVVDGIIEAVNPAPVQVSKDEAEADQVRAQDTRDAQKGSAVIADNMAKQGVDVKPAVPLSTTGTGAAATAGTGLPGAGPAAAPAGPKA